MNGKDSKPQGMIAEQFDKNNEIAKTDILWALNDKVLFNVQITNTTAKTLWENLIKVYEDKSLMNKINLRRQLYNSKMKDRVLSHEHLNEFNTLLNNLKINEKEQVTLLLCSIVNS